MILCVKVSKNSIAINQDHMESRIAFVVDIFKGRYQIFYLTTHKGQTVETNYRMKNYDIAMIAIANNEINYNKVTYEYTRFYVCNNAQRRSVITADLKVHSITAFTALDCSTNICSHANIIVELRQSYIAYIRSQRPRQRFLGQDGKYGNNKVVTLHYLTHSRKYIVMFLFEDTVYIYELPGAELEVGQGFKPSSWIERNINKWVAK